MRPTTRRAGWRSCCRRTAGLALALALASVLSTFRPPAAAAAGDRPVPVDRQGDAHTSTLPATYVPQPDRVYVSQAGLDAQSEAYVKLDLTVLGADEVVEDLQLSLVEAPAGLNESLVPETAAIIGCLATGPFSGGRQGGESTVEVDCGSVSTTPGSRGPDGVWTFDLTPLASSLRTPDTSVALVADASAPSAWRVAFVTSETAASVRVPDVPTLLAPAPVGADPAPPIAGPGDGAQLSIPPVPDVPSPAVEASPEVPPRVGSVPSGSAPVPDGSDAGSGRLPAIALVLIPALAMAVGLATPSVRLGALAGRLKENVVSIDQLPALNRRLRHGTLGAVALSVLVLAAMTSAPTRDTGPNDLMAGGAGGLNSEEDGEAAGAQAMTATTGDSLTDAEALATPGLEEAPNEAGATGAARGPDGAPVSETRTPGAAPLSATDQGVTATSIKVGVFRVDPGYLAALGVADPKVERIAPAYAAEINERGGVHGRKLEVDVITVADFSQSQMEQGCRTAFVDHQDFMLLNHAAYIGLPRCAASYGRGLTDSGFGEIAVASAAMLEGLGGHYWIAGPTADRFVESWADFLVTKHPKDTKIGLWNGSQDSLVQVGRQMTAALVARGFAKPSYFQSAPDASTAAIQISNAAAQFRRDGVQLVVPIADPIEVGLAQRGFSANNYRPERGWTFSSIATMDNADNAALFDPQQMNGASGLSWLRQISEPEQVECRGILQRRAPGVAWSATAAMFCHLMFQNARALENAGTNLTTATWAQGYSKLRTYQGNQTATQTFTPTKRDGADQAREWTFRNGQFSVAGPWRNM